MRSKLSLAPKKKKSLDGENSLLSTVDSVKGVLTEKKENSKKRTLRTHVH
jgi:hypothetical protein